MNILLLGTQRVLHLWWALWSWEEGLLWGRYGQQWANPEIGGWDEKLASKVLKSWGKNYLSFSFCPPFSPPSQAGFAAFSFFQRSRDFRILSSCLANVSAFKHPSAGLSPYIHLLVGTILARGIVVGWVVNSWQQVNKSPLRTFILVLGGPRSGHGSFPWRKRMAKSAWSTKARSQKSKVSLTWDAAQHNSAKISWGLFRVGSWEKIQHLCFCVNTGFLGPQYCSNFFWPQFPSHQIITPWEQHYLIHCSIFST